MTRDEAIKRIHANSLSAASIGSGAEFTARNFCANLIDALIALDVLKIDAPIAAREHATQLLVNAATPRNGFLTIDSADALIRIIESAGLKIVRADGSE